MSQAILRQLDTLFFDLDTGTYRAEFNRKTVTPTMAVIAVLSCLENTRPSSLDPLYDKIDTDALNRLCGTDTPFRYDGERIVAFKHNEYTISVSSDGVVIIGSAPEWDGDSLLSISDFD